MDIPLLKAITSACVVTWFNPQAIIDGTMLLGAFRATLSSETGMYFILGVTSASFCWFMGLSIFVKSNQYSLWSSDNFLWCKIIIKFL